MSKRAFALSATMLTALAGCGPTPAPTVSPPEELTSQPAPTVGEPTEASAASTGLRDLESVDLCGLIHNDEIAGLLGAEPTRDELEGATGLAGSY